MLCYVFFLKFQLPIWLHSSCSISLSAGGNVKYDPQNITPKWTPQSVQLISLFRQPRVLRRHRRFVLPQNSGWAVSFGSTLSIPIEGASSSLSFSIPFSYKFDSGMWVCTDVTIHCMEPACKVSILSKESWAYKRADLTSGLWLSITDSDWD